MLAVFDTNAACFGAHDGVLSRVEWEFWTSSNDGCGDACDIQTKFKKEFRDTAAQMEKVTRLPMPADSKLPWHKTLKEAFHRASHATFI